MREIVTTGKTIEDALEKAALELKIDKDEIEYEVIETPSNGFLGFGAKPAKIHAKCDVRKPEPQKEPIKREAPKKAEFKPTSAPTPTATLEPKLDKKEEDEVFVPSENGLQFAKDFLADLFKNMNFKIEISAEQKGKFIEINLKGDDVGNIIGKHGDTLDAIQHMCQLAFNKAIKGSEKIRIDTEGYREKREKTLVGLAKSIANRVIKSRGKYELEPMKAYERRIIHATLQSYPMLTTYSVGTEPQRRIVIAFKHREKQ